jgi:hypothetical protein
MQDERHIAIRLTAHALALTVLVVVTVGCSGAKVTTRSSDELPRYHVRSLALVPFTSIVTPQVRDQGDPFFTMTQGSPQSDISVAIPPTIPPRSKQALAVPDYAAEKVTELFWNRLQSREGVNVLPLGDSTKAASANGEPATMARERVAASVAKRLKADAALIGLISVYQERVGGRFGANPAAAVGFEVTAVAADGKVLWVGNYYERQRPMTEDFVGFMQRSGMFVTAEELAEYGVDQMLKVFPFGVGGGP